MERNGTGRVGVGFGGDLVEVYMIKDNKRNE
jgi:hypothetical protein